MKPISIPLMVLALGLSCSSALEVIAKKINLTVIDEKSNAPIDSVQVIFTSIIGAKDINKGTRYTNALGICSFSFDYEPEASYEILAKKRGYFSYIVDDSDSGSGCKSNIRITESTKEKIILYLTSDSLQNANYWKKKTIRYNIDTLIQILRGNEFQTIRGIGLPLLIWDDIPKLLEISNDTTMLSNFPRNGISSYWQKECYLGVISMWMIESIRIIEEKGIFDPFERYPSLNPIIRQNGRLDNKPDLVKMELASNIYMDWWRKVGCLDKKEACRINPFKDSDIGW
jgi:hypothetical protein